MPYGAQIVISPTVTIQIEVAGGQFPDDAQKAIIEACSFWQSVPQSCPMPGCGAPLTFTARHPQGYHYYGLECLGPKPHEMNFGERKDHTSLYFKDDAWKDAHQRGGDEGPASAQGAPAQAPPAQTPPPATAPGVDAKVDAGFIRMLQAIANAKNPKPDLDGVSQNFFSKNVADITKSQAEDLREYLKSL